jgi:tRNA G18 (ribose-2'-O)-methylase SpoU
MRKIANSELGRVAIQDYRNMNRSRHVVVLDNIRSAMNVGSIFRTADAFGIDALFLCGITATPPSREMEKTALGATASVPWRYYASSAEALLHLKTLNYLIVGIEQLDQSISLEQHKPAEGQACAFVFGNEVHGLSDNILDLLDAGVEIPQFGSKHSFNVAVSAGIIMWHYLMCLPQKG